MRPCRRGGVDEGPAARQHCGADRVAARRVEAAGGGDTVYHFTHRKRVDVSKKAKRRLLTSRGGRQTVDFSDCFLICWLHAQNTARRHSEQCMHRALLTAEQYGLDRKRATRPVEPRALNDFLRRHWISGFVLTAKCAETNVSAFTGRSFR